MIYYYFSKPFQFHTFDGIVLGLLCSDCQSSTDLLPFVSSDCSSMGGGVSTDILANDYCGVYDADISDVFGACVVGHSALASMFADICQSDFCENYLTTDEGEELMSSGCVDAGECSLPVLVLPGLV